MWPILEVLVVFKSAGKAARPFAYSETALILKIDDVKAFQ